MADAGRAIWQWKQLPAADRRRLLKLARRGEPGPDRRVAEIGLAWADAMLASSAARPGSRPGRLLAFLLSLATRDLYDEDVGARWIARKIVRANRPVDWTSEKPMEHDQAVRQAVRAALLNELESHANSQPLTIEPDWLTEYAASLADVTVGGFEVNPPNGPPVKQDQAVWVVVHATMLGELESRANARPLTIELDQLGDWADELADVIVDRFKVSPRPASRPSAASRRSEPNR